MTSVSMLFRELRFRKSNFALSLFAVVVAAFYLSRFVRFVLQEDVFPRVVLRRGVSNAISTTVNYTILLGGISSVMAGSIFGDHCSPISDTTVMSSMASGCDHVDHVRTQLPYALMVGVVGMLVGDIPTAYGMSPWISLMLGMVVIWAIIRFVGKKPEEVVG